MKVEDKEILKDLFDRGNLDLTKQIEVLKKKLQDTQNELALIKAVNDNSPERLLLLARIKDLEEINKSHHRLNSELRKDIHHYKQKSSKLESAENLLQGYKKVIIELTAKLRKKDS